MSYVATEGNMRAYWDNSDLSPFKGAPFRLHSFMSFACFDAIKKALSFTDLTPPLYRDKIWEVRRKIHAWNWHISDVFLAGRVSCLDESMPIWTSRWMCQYLCSSHVNLIQSGMNTIPLRMDYVEFSLVWK